MHDAKQGVLKLWHFTYLLTILVLHVDEFGKNPISLFNAMSLFHVPSFQLPSFVIVVGVENCKLDSISNCNF